MNEPSETNSLMQPLLRPRSVALFGASDDVSKTAGRPLKYLRDAGFAGKVYAINPRRATVQGEMAYPDIAALPEVPDHAFVLTPTESVIGAAEECARAGVKIVTILASGFSETGAEGARREDALRKLSRETGTRILGPSSLGIVVPSSGLMLTANAAFAEPKLGSGSVFVASHSGSMIGALVSRGKARGVGFAGLVSVGNEADLSIGEICRSTLYDPSIEGYILFLESIRHGRELRSFALEAVKLGKPIVAYKLGRSNVAAEMAATHTGALAGEDDIADAFLKDLGIARVDVLESLLETFPLAKRIPLMPAGDTPRRVGVVTTTGGGAAMAVDQLGIRDVTVEPPSPKTLARLAAAGIAAGPGRVLDLTLAGTKYDVMKAALDVFLSAPEFDLVLAVVGSSARFQPQLAVKPILDSAIAKKPLAAFLVPDAPEAVAMLTEAGVPCFRSPEACGETIASVFNRRFPGSQLVTPPRMPRNGRPLSEAQAYGVLDEIGVQRAPTAIAKLSEDAPELPFAYPVAAKICSEDIQHKTEVGGVILNIANSVELTAALSTLRQNVASRAPGIHVEEALIQPMQRWLAEVLVGYRNDSEAGPIIMLAAGGIWTEIARDRSIRLAPIDVKTAREMIGEVNALKTLTGLRGKPRGDLDKLAEAISSLSQLANRPDLRIVEAEVNPLLVLPEGSGVTAVDALIIRS